MNLKKQRFTLIILLTASMLMHLVYGLEGQAQMSELESERNVFAKENSVLNHKIYYLNSEIESYKFWDKLEKEYIEKLENEVRKDPKETYIGEFTITYYCPCVKCCGKTDGITASGTLAKEGQTVAADWEVLPPGTEIFIEGIGFRTVEDKGGAIKGNRLDVYMDSHSSALDAGVVQAKVYVLEGSKNE
ncbi:3D (Asp-Asp-Asp) domain-containing protein [Sedimentibacter acidaminivorans]|uniref:3D (Asp-Asp-Asp) domain-containing protein n=1 Tax=Sedimentibacter acidaminivorans TaxID=913099 RepID=A0ABS4GAB3_9FIRM|nr:3D domain-containing protein [Sedimentibacter acidaminivorans]MBP1924628.1 3D (Asp-Asp-Asp) domain-containing protein [Sedimentibacter acidaminivorans]